MSFKSYIIAICGGSASGKTTFARKLHKKFAERSSLIYQDNYYIDQSAKFDGDGGSVNFDHPDAIEFSLMATQLEQLKYGNSINVPIYDFASHSRKSETILVKATPFVLVDGILILNDESLRELFDLMIFIDTSEDIRYKRRLLRDTTERGRTEEGVRKQFFKQVAPMHNQFVETSKIHAHKIYSGEKDFTANVNEIYEASMRKFNENKI